LAPTIIIKKSKKEICIKSRSEKRETGSENTTTQPKKRTLREDVGKND